MKHNPERGALAEGIPAPITRAKLGPPRTAKGKVRRTAAQSHAQELAPSLARTASTLPCPQRAWGHLWPRDGLSLFLLSPLTFSITIKPLCTVHAEPRHGVIR